MADSTHQKPMLRAVEALPGPDGSIVLRDPHDPELPALKVNAQVAPLLMLLDGTNDLRDLQAAYMRHHGTLVFSEELEGFIEGLRTALMLEGEEFEAHRRRLLEAFRQAPSRPCVHAGTCYAAEPDGLAAQLERYSAQAEAELPDHKPKGPASGVVVPHLDPTACGRAYAAAYRWTVRAGGADLYVILGTGHGGLDEGYAVTGQAFDTPLGCIETDLDAVGKLQDYTQIDLYQGELLHRTEHTIEFQAVCLAHFAPPDRPFRIVPVLCGFRHHPFALLGREPPAVTDFIQALKRLVEEEQRRVCIIASVDLAHLGPRYGDTSGLNPGAVADLEQRDRQLIDLVEAGHTAGFLQHILSDDNARRVCGFSPLYTLLRTLDQSSGVLLDYGAAAVDREGSFVSYCAMGLTVGA